MVLLSWPFTEKDIEAQRALVIAGSSKIESRFKCKDSDLISHTLNYWLQKTSTCKSYGGIKCNETPWGGD